MMTRAIVALTALLSLNAAEVRVELGQPGRKASPGLFGIFVEEINHAGDGGLYSELVRNGSFAEAQTLDGWFPVRTGSARMNAFFEAAVPLSPAKARSLRVEVTAQGGEKTGIANEGYWGMAVAKGASYDFSARIRANREFSGPVTISLEGPNGAVYARQEITGLTPAWKPVTAVLTSNETNPKAHLTITTTQSGTFYLNLVSLRPAGGDLFRADLLQKLKDLKPAFLRFPGGTYVQGNERDSAFHWKETIGPLEERAGHRNSPWVYWSSDNLGFHEYLLLCERLAAVPMYVAYAGMTWTATTRSPFGVLHPSRIPASDIPLDEMGPVVQDVVDAIEYANGPVTSKWGALRAKAGHPAPFGLQYLEIGNEDGANPLYKERYTMIYNAVKAKFPGVRIIANSGRGGAPPVPMDFIDEHAYVKPQEAVQMAMKYDKREQKGAKVFLGEYAVQHTAGFGNMRAALGDAILLSSVERNSDLMPLASYAPLLANVNAVNWKPNLIYFDSATAVGTPSYYVQKMFADSRLDTVVPVHVTAPLLTVPLTVPGPGNVKAEGFDAQAEVRDEKVTPGEQGYTYTLRARKTSGDGGLSIRFATHEGDGSYLTWILGVKRRGLLLVWGGGGLLDVPMYSLENSFGGPIGNQVPGTIEKDRWYDVKIQVQGRKVTCFLDGKQIQEATLPDNMGPSLYGEAGRSAGGDIVVRMVNLSPAPQEVSVDLQGAAESRFRASATELASKNLDLENSVAEPMRISPVQSAEKVVGNQFKWEVAGNSFTVLTIKAAGAR